MAIHWKAVEQYFTVCVSILPSFRKFINFGLGTVWSETVKLWCEHRITNRISKSYIWETDITSNGCGNI